MRQLKKNKLWGKATKLWYNCCLLFAWNYVWIYLRVPEIKNHHDSIKWVQFRVPTMLHMCYIQLMAEILHQLIGSLTYYLHGFIHPGWCRISAINSINPGIDGNLLVNIFCSRGAAPRTCGKSGLECQGIYPWNDLISSQITQTCLRVFESLKNINIYIYLHIFIEWLYVYYIAKGSLEV